MTTWLLFEATKGWLEERKLTYTVDWSKIICTCCVLSHGKGFELATVFLDCVVVSAPQTWEEPYSHKPNRPLWPEKPDFFIELEKELVEAHRLWMFKGHLWNRRDT